MPVCPSCFRAAKCALVFALGLLAPCLLGATEALRAFIKGDPVPLASGANPPRAKLGEPAPEGINWEPVSDSNWVAARCVIEPPNKFNGSIGTAVSLYRPASDAKIALIELEADGPGTTGLGDVRTVLTGALTRADGKELPVRLYRTHSEGMLALSEPFSHVRERGMRTLFFRFAVGTPGSVTLALTAGRKIRLQSRDFAVERAARLARLVERLDPVRGGPDWSAIDESLLEFFALEHGGYSTAALVVMEALQPLLPALAEELATESPAAAKIWTTALADLHKRWDGYRKFAARDLDEAWKAACTGGGIPVRGPCERIGRRALRSAGLATEVAAALEKSWRAADTSTAPEEWLRMRAETHRHLKDEAVRTALDRALAERLRDVVLRLNKEDKWLGRTAGLALWAHLLGGGKIDNTVTADAAANLRGEDMLSVARANLAPLALKVWPVLAPPHAETARLQAFLGSEPLIAGAPMQAVLGLRPGTAAEFLKFRERFGAIDPLVLGGGVVFFHSKQAPPLQWPVTFTNTDPKTSTNPLIRQRGVVQQARARPGELLSSFEFWTKFYGAPAEELKALTAQRQALAARQQAALAAAQKARDDWAAAQQYSWEHPRLVTDYSAMYVVRGLRTPEMAQFEERHAEALKEAATSGGQDEGLRKREFEIMERLRAQRALADLPKLLENLKAADAALAREEAKLARMEAAEARRVFHTGPGGHDERRRAALRAYYRSGVARQVKALHDQPVSAERESERLWQCWWFGVEQPESGQLPAELRPEASWLPEVATTICEGELHRALALETIDETYAAAAAAIDRVRSHVALSQQGAVLAPGVQDFRRKLTPDEFAAFRERLGIDRWSAVQLALLAPVPKPASPATTKQTATPQKK